MGFHFSKYIDDNLFDINERRLACADTITTEMLVEGEQPHESLKQEFIVVHGIVEDCILGLDAPYGHRFMIDGHERCVYRVKESDQLPNRRDPFLLVASKLKLPPFSACVIESAGKLMVFHPTNVKPPRKIIDELLRYKIIPRSLSQWATPIVLVKKKTADVRLCVEYRKLNAITNKDSFPLLRIDDVLDMLDGQKIFSTIDLTAEYWQIEMDDESKEKTAFIADNNLYEWNYLAFGLTNSPGTFQRVMNFVLRGVLGRTCLVYLDDIIVFSKTKEKHFNNFRQIFKLLDEANFLL